LSIIDLSDAANQPYEINQYRIVFNGEIYNYKEIRTELIELGYSFKTDSDTEVLLQSYIHWGKAALEKFLGMWAFAIWNSEEKTLFCSRDRFGIKPFYYIQNGGRFYFASEVKSLKYSPLYTNDVNINQLSRSMQLGWIGFKNETAFNCVQQLEPGCCLILKNDQITHEKYWQIEQKDNHFSTTDELIHTYANLFNDSLKLHLRSDVQLGATLSGGIDSSSIVSALINDFNIHDLKTFSIYYEGKNAVDERPFIREIEKQYAGKFQSSYYSPDDSSIVEEYDTISHHCDFPLLGSSSISQYFVMKEISKQGVKVILSGQGADDYLGGYMHTYYRFYGEMLRSMKLMTAFKELRLHKKRQELGLGALSKVMMKSLLTSCLSEQSLYRLEYNKYYPTIFEGLNDSIISLPKSGFKKVNDFHVQLMNHTSLPSLLHYEDRNSMAFSIESRVPFLDHRLVELGINSRAEEKIHNGYTKYLLREAMRPVLPEAIRNRTDKKGFVTPGEVKWLRGNLSHLLDIDYSSIPQVNKKNVASVIDQFKKGDNSNSNLVWRIASLNHWLKTI
jgi:asparagine synthase (glutamine-hydrolysing)